MNKKECMRVALCAMAGAAGAQLLVLAVGSCVMMAAARRAGWQCVCTGECVPTFEPHEECEAPEA